MFQRVLVGYLDGDQGRDALALGTALARAAGAELIVATAPEEDGRDLPELVQARGADLVVLGSTHRGSVGRVIPGATVERLLGGATCAVAVAPPGFGDPAAAGDLNWHPLSGDTDDVGMRVVGVGYDGSPASVQALKAALDLALPNGAALRVYTVAPKHAHMPGAENAATATPGTPSEADVRRQWLDEAVKALPSEARALPVFLRGFPEMELVKASKVGVDLMVLGCRHGGPVRRALHHSVTGAVMRDAACPVLILPVGVDAPQSVSPTAH